LAAFSATKFDRLSQIVGIMQSWTSMCMLASLASPHDSILRHVFSRTLTLFYMPDFTPQFNAHIFHTMAYPQYLDAFNDFDELHSVLSTLKFPNVKHRFKNIPVNRSLTFGLIKNRITRKIQPSAITLKHPDVYDLLFSIGEKIVPFEFTTIHVNKNVVAPRHVDSLVNQSLSVIVSFGDYDGCNLVVETPSGEVEFNAHHHPLMFDGRLFYHWNTPLESGTKYSLIFYDARPNQPKGGSL